jgi:SAM-dependent methyltransferase
MEEGVPTPEQQEQNEPPLAPSPTFKDRLIRAFIAPKGVASQGKHLDPAELPPPDVLVWPREQRAAWGSPEMDVFRSCLRIGSMDERSSVLDDLSKFHSLSPQECLERCLHWERWSVSEWKSGDRTTTDGLQAFYDSVQSWSFDLSWYAYNQAMGFGYPASVLAVKFAREHVPGGAHLDFGSGVGVTSQLFRRFGFSSTLGDVSKPLLDFASFRHERRGERIPLLNLAASPMPDAAYDIVTAVDTLVHVPVFSETVRALHRAIRPGGWLLANFDVRLPAEESAWHLHNDDLRLHYELHQGGFVRMKTLAGATYCYQRVEPGGVLHRAATFRQELLMTPPARAVTTTARRIRWPTPLRVARALERLKHRLVAK